VVQMREKLFNPTLRTNREESELAARPHTVVSARRAVLGARVCKGLVQFGLNRMPVRLGVR
jgi:hypothetical protein